MVVEERIYRWQQNRGLLRQFLNHQYLSFLSKQKLVLPMIRSWALGWPQILLTMVLGAHSYHLLQIHEHLQQYLFNLYRF